MKYTISLLAAVMVFLPSCVFASTTLLDSFEAAQGLQNLSVRSATIAIGQSGVTDGSYALGATFTPLSTASSYIQLSSSTPENFQTFDGIAVDVTNPNATPVNISLLLYDSSTPSGTNDSRSGVATIPAGAVTTVYLTFPTWPNPIDYGMTALPKWTPETPLDAGYYGTSAFSLSHIYALRVALSNLTQATTLYFDNIRLVNHFSLSSLNNIIDPYGQYSLYSGITKSSIKKPNFGPDVPLNPSKTVSAAFFDHDLWGGWSSGPHLRGTNYFRTKYINGKWWLVDPSGNLFLSIGMNTVDYGNLFNQTIVSKRQQIFQWLPTSTDPLAVNYGADGAIRGPVTYGTTFNFYSANLDRKFGFSFTQSWQNETLSRLSNWGFNTLGGWSDQGIIHSHRIAYIDSVDIKGNFDAFNSGNNHWGLMPDPFDPNYAVAVSADIQPMIAADKNDPWCVGYYVDNELGWYQGSISTRYSLPVAVLGLDASASPAKTEFVRELIAKYGSIFSLDQAWQTSFYTWADVSAPITLTASVTTNAKSDLSVFLKAYAEKYFSTIAAAIHAQDPNHLYLGCRIAAPAYGDGVPSLPMEVVQSAADNCDVVSFNFYGTSIDPKAWSFLPYLNKPVIFAEFGCGATDTGLFWAGLLDAGSQAGRATEYANFFNSAISSPSIIGCHWFEYIDQPVSGRSYDCENANYGFINVTDTVYPDIAASAQNTNLQAYNTRGY